MGGWACRPEQGRSRNTEGAQPVPTSTLEQAQAAYQLCCSPPGRSSSGPRRPLRALPPWRSPCWRPRMPWGWRYSRSLLRTWSLTPPGWTKFRWLCRDRPAAGLGHGGEGGRREWPDQVGLSVSVPCRSLRRPPHPNTWIRTPPLPCLTCIPSSKPPEVLSHTKANG